MLVLDYHAQCMSSPADLVTVFRSFDPDRVEETKEKAELLARSGLHPVLADDSAPGVVTGCYEVRVPASESRAAEQVLSMPPPEPLPDLSPQLDPELIYYNNGSNAEIEALAIRSILEANGIEVLTNATSQVFATPWEVRVARKDVARAKQILAEAQAAGPAAAEEAERETEGRVPPSPSS